jgi:hypothetical protein
MLAAEIFRLRTAANRPVRPTDLAPEAILELRVREVPAAERAVADLALDVPVADLALEPAAERAVALLAPELPAADRALVV